MLRMDNKKLRFVFIVFLLIFSIFIKIYDLLVTEKVTHLNKHQLTKIDQSLNDFSFIVMGDSRNSIETFNNLIMKINKENSLFTINLGDFVYNGDTFRYKFYLNQIRKFNKPLLNVIGNHEIRKAGGIGRKNYKNYLGEYYYSFAIGNSYFVVLDNADFTIDSRQMEWLKKQLEKSKNYKYRFVFAHVPLYDPRKGNHVVGHSMVDTILIKEINNLLDYHNVTMMFVSHIHAYYRGVWGKTPYIISGGAGAKLRGTDPSNNFHHYIKVNISDTKVQYNVVKVEGPKSKKMDKVIYELYMFKYGYLINTLIIFSLIYLGVVVFKNKRFRKYLLRS